MARHLTLLFALQLLAASALAQAPNIVAYEYWFDQNDTQRSYVPVSPSDTVNLTNAQLNTTGLSLGQHQACLRWKDQSAMGQARWSSVVCRTLHVGRPGPWEIVALRYWVGDPANDADPAIRYLYFDTPQTQVDYDGLLELCSFPSGLQALRLQLLDNHGQWSSVVTRPVNITATPNMEITSIASSATALCTGDSVTFTAQPNTASDFALPTGYTWSFPSDWTVQPSDSATIVVTVGSELGEITVTGSNSCGQTPAYSLTVTNVCNVGVGGQDGGHSAFVVSPNPSTGPFRITYPTSADPKELMIMDAWGRQVTSHYTFSGTHSMDLDLRHEASGIYFLRMRLDNAWISTPLLLER